MSSTREKQDRVLQGLFPRLERDVSLGALDEGPRLSLLLALLLHFRLLHSALAPCPSRWCQ